MEIKHVTMIGAVIFFCVGALSMLLGNNETAGTEIKIAGFLVVMRALFHFGRTLGPVRISSKTTEIILTISILLTVAGAVMLLENQWGMIVNMAAKVGAGITFVGLAGCLIGAFLRGSKWEKEE